MNIYLIYGAKIHLGFQTIVKSLQLQFKHTTRDIYIINNNRNSCAGGTKNHTFFSGRTQYATAVVGGNKEEVRSLTTQKHTASQRR